MQNEMPAFATVFAMCFLSFTIKTSDNLWRRIDHGLRDSVSVTSCSIACDDELHRFEDYIGFSLSLIRPHAVL